MCRLHLRQLLGTATGGRIGNDIAENTLPILRNTMNKKLFVLGFLLLLSCIPVNSEIFLNKWAVHIEGGQETANDLAARHGFKCLGQVRQIVLLSLIYV